MAASAITAANKGTFAATKTAEEIIEIEGGVYHLKGRRKRGSSAKPQRVRLTATSNVREFVKANNRRTVVGLVKGTPAGFWSIVEHGRRGGYVIINRDAKLGRARGALPTRNVTFKRERREIQSANRSLAVGQGKLDTKGKLIWIPEYGRAFPFVRPKPAGPQGRPWRRAMIRCRRQCRRSFAGEYVKPLEQAFKGGYKGVVGGVRRYQLPIGKQVGVTRSTFRGPVAP